MQLTLTVCNVCQDRSAETHRYEVKRDDGRKTVIDLCEAHRAPIEELLGDRPNGSTSAAQRGAQGARRGGRRPRVVDIEEVERLKLSQS